MARVKPSFQLYTNSFKDCFLRRVAARQDTCALVAISLNLVDQVHPVIWTLGHLPFDCLQAMPVPKPIGKENYGECVEAILSLEL